MTPRTGHARAPRRRGAGAPSRARPAAQARRAPCRASVRRWRWILCAPLLALGAGALHALPQTAGIASAAEAALELERGSAHAAAGRYERARDAYERVARRWPATPAGREAALRLEQNGLFGWTDIVRHGPSEALIDVVVLGDGYTFEQQDAFDDVAADLPRTLERSPVFGEYFSCFNFLRANLVSAEAGLDGYGRQASTALGARVLESTNAANVAVDPARVHALLRRVPASEGLAIAVVKRGTSGTGGGGIATIGGSHFETLLHEWGHAFGDLGDEYATDLGFRHRRVRTSVNVSLTEDEERVPWAHWIAAGAPGIGVYEGAAGQVRDVWRPKASGCVMNDTDLFFCEPCREALVLAIYERVDPIQAFGLSERGSADVARELDRAGLGSQDGGQELVLSQPLELEARVLQPASHDLEASWWLLPADQAPALAPETRPRSERGPLAELAARPAEHEKRVRDGRSTWRVDPRGLAPGRYLVLLRVRDTTLLAGERLPWVLRDEHELLRSERGLWIRVP